MSKVIYHGSKVQGLTEIKPKESTQAGHVSVYATEIEEIAAAFALWGGTIQIGRSIQKDENNNYEKIVLVERVENLIKDMQGKFSIYTLSDDDFEYFTKDSWGKYEKRTSKPQRVLTEKVFNNATELIEYYTKNNKMVYYEYPNKPSYYKQDNSDLIDSCYSIYKMGQPKIFEQLLKWHPYLEDKTIEFLKEKKLSQLLPPKK